MIDTHQHFWRYRPADYPWIDDRMAVIRRDFLPEDAGAAMNGTGFTASIAVQARQSLDETGVLLELAEANPFIIGVVGWVDLCADDVATTLRRVASNPRLVGIRHIVQDEPDDRFLLRPEFCRGMALLEDFGLAYDLLIHVRHLPVAAEFVTRFPRQRFVLDHLAKPEIASGRIGEWETGVRRLAEAPNVWAKLSGLVTEARWASWREQDLRPYLDVAMDAFGPERLMVGSDWPVCTVASDYARTMRVWVEYLANRPAAERAAVLDGNARRFWNLQPA